MDKTTKEEEQRGEKRTNQKTGREVPKAGKISEWEGALIELISPTISLFMRTAATHFE